MTYPSDRFLTGVEAALVKRDYECMLMSSCHSSVITGEYKIPTSPVVDDVYKIVDASSWTAYAFTGHALQKIVTQQDERLLAMGIVEVGDCIFYLSTELDLEQGYPETLELIDPGEQRWIPNLRRQGEAQRYLLHRLGETQVAQVLPCRLKK